MTLAPEKTWSVPQALFASMPWYDLPEIRDATDAFWAALVAKLAERGIEDVPKQLDRDVPYGVDWNSKCLFTQTCGYPIFTTARSQFHVLGIPCYTRPDVMVRCTAASSSCARVRTFATLEISSRRHVRDQRTGFEFRE